MKNYRVYLIISVLSLFVWNCTSTHQLENEKGYVLTKNQKEHIYTGTTNEPMRIWLITNPEDSILLRTKSTNFELPKDAKDAEFLASRMLATVTDSASLGVGIAAPQVGVLKNLILVQRFDLVDEPIVAYYNPKITSYSKLKQPCLEGCLSIPNKMDTTRNRAYAIILEHELLNGEHKQELVEDFTAVIFQHEIDHLNGILFLDHLDQEIKDAEDSLMLKRHR